MNVLVLAVLYGLVCAVISLMIAHFLGTFWQLAFIPVAIIGGMVLGAKYDGN